MLSDKPEAIKNDDFVDKLYETINNDPNKDKRPTFKALHFTDIHVDFKYVSGAQRYCDDLLCCRAVNGFPVNKS
jgi:hypothetical protein